MNKPVTLVTGASRGIGRATCVELVKNGHHVVALARTIGALEDLADEVGDENITLVPQDMTDGKALENLGPMLFEKFGRVDNFIANAGMISTLSPLSQCNTDEWNKVFQVNVTANVHLLRSLQPLLSHADTANVVFLTSNVAEKPRAYWGAYAASKAAVAAMAEIYRQEVENTPIHVHCYNPGSVATAMWTKSHPGVDQSHLKQPAQAAEEIMSLLPSIR